MTKKRLFMIGAALTALAVPSIAFANHVSGCCGDIWCCLKNLGCC